MSAEVESEFVWRDHAICRYANDDIFFAEGYGATYPKARTYCSTCPVVIDCLIEGVDDADDVGMWGCMSPNERHAVRVRINGGASFKRAVEAIWSKERRKFNGNIVPPKSVWKDWDA